MNKIKWIVAIGLSSASFAATAAEVNVYSGRAEVFVKPLLEKFTDQTGIEVNLLSAKDDALIARLESEGRNSPADVLLTADAGRLLRAESAGLLKPVESEVLFERIPEQYRDTDNHWYGFTMRSRPIMAAKGRVAEGEITTYEELADAKWKGRICVRSSDNVYNQSFIASMIANHGAEKTEEWIEGFVANFARPPSGGDRDQIAAVVAGECDLALANTYYLAGMLDGQDPKQREIAEQITVVWPNQDSTGAHVNISGAGVTKSSRNTEEAIKLLEFMTSEMAQVEYAQGNHEYPVVEGIEMSDTLKGFGDFKADDLRLDKLGEHNAEGVRIMDRAGWR
ncbi:MAG: Fe(3+) ABC transporter substrate-binding protein [Halothiobacillaceae bacterium]